MDRQKGFSLVELLIVVAIILIIAAIAIPNLLRARISANQSAAAQGTRTITTAELQYMAAYPTVGYSASLPDLGPGAGACSPPTSAGACLIDGSLANSGATAKSGYLYSEVGSVGTGSGTTNQVYSAGAIPASLNRTGVHSYCAFEDSVVRVDTAGADHRATCDATITALQ
jgi:prepilin-type N-terminal cleavage/methylation domain-containing protein